MRLFIKLMIVVVGACLAFEAEAQLGQFSQYYTSSLFLNPTFAGIPPNLQVSMNHKRQITDVGYTNELSQFSLLYPFVSGGFNARQFGGVGISAFTENADNNFKTTGFMASAAYNIRLGDFSPDYVIVGLQGGLLNRTVNFANATWSSQYTPFLPGGFDPNSPDPSVQFNDNINFPVLNVGLTYYFNPARTYRLYKYSAFSGFAFRNVNRPNTSLAGEEKVPEVMIITYHGGFEFSISNQFRWSPHAVINYRLDNSYVFNLGNYVSYSFSNNRALNANNVYLTLGLWYRVRDSFIITTGFQNNNLGVAFSYDLNRFYIFTPDNDITLPSFEISLTYTLGKTKKGGSSSNPLF